MISWGKTGERLAHHSLTTVFVILIFVFHVIMSLSLDTAMGFSCIGRRPQWMMNKVVAWARWRAAHAQFSFDTS